MSALGPALARELLAALRDDPGLRAELRALLAELLAPELAAGRRGDGRRWLTLAEAAERLGCSPAAARMRAARGRLVTRRQGRRVYVSADSLDRLEGVS